ncbi:MFS general substrate transporter [Lichtheimia hyalospora FSU 10163]|nr:MFS general substrate transporter [Lichtheimia hyalospora FSU 10163]
MTTITTTALEEPVTSITSTIQEPEKATHRDRNRTYLPNGNSDNETSTVHSPASSISTAPTMIGSDDIRWWLWVVRRVWRFLSVFDKFWPGIMLFYADYKPSSLSPHQGVMQEYFNRVVFKDAPNAQLGLTLVGTTIEIFANMMGPLYQYLTCRYGVRPVLVLGTLLVVLGLEMSGFATEIWHLVITQGVLFGIGASLLYVAAMMVPSQWFNRKSAMAMGCVTSGSCLGGVTLPFLMTAINNRLGAAWTYRIVGFVCLGANAITCLLVKEKFPSNIKVKGHENNEHPEQSTSSDNGNDQQQSKQCQNEKARNKTFNLEIFKNINFNIWMASGIINTAGYFIPFFFVPSYATYLGLSTADGTSLMAITSGSNFFGRICTGFLGDRIGRLNAHIMSTFMTVISLLVLWMVADTYAKLVAFAIMFGFACSSFFIFLSPVTGRILSAEQVPTGISLMILSNIISVCGPPLATAIQDQVPDKPYLVLKLFTGVCYLISLVLLVLLKIRMTRSLLSRI